MEPSIELQYRSKRLWLGRWIERRQARGESPEPMGLGKRSLPPRVGKRNVEDWRGAADAYAQKPREKSVAYEDQEIARSG